MEEEEGTAQRCFVNCGHKVSARETIRLEGISRRMTLYLQSRKCHVEMTTCFEGVQSLRNALDVSRGRMLEAKRESEMSSVRSMGW